MDGSNIGFDAADPAQGVFLTDADGHIVASLLSYGRYMLEVCDLSPIGA